MTIKEICEILKTKLINTGFEYGFVLNGKKYTPKRNIGFDSEYYSLSTTIYLVQHPSDTLKYKIGTCVDTVLVMRYILDELNLPSKIWLIHNKAKNKVHTILTFKVDEKIVYLELTPESSKSWYGKEIIYSNEGEMILEYESKGYDVTDVTDSIVIGEQPHFLLAKIK